MDAIVESYLEKDGSFYLCGPTWPVPDVTGVLMEAIGLDAGKRGEVYGVKQGGKKVDERRVIEELKDGGRYVLEVY